MDEPQNPPVAPQEPVQEVPPVAETIPSAIPTGSGWLTGKVVAIILVLLVAGGAGAYFFFFQDSSSVSCCAGTTTPVATSQQKTSGLPFHCKDLLPDADFERISGEKISNFIVEEKPDTYSGGGSLMCYYKKGYEIINFSITWDTNHEHAHTSTQALVNMANQAPGEDMKKVEGVGSEAFTGGGLFLAVSSNNRYSIQITYQGKEVELAKAVDANLNRY